MWWIIGIIVLLIILGVAFYVYKKKSKSGVSSETKTAAGSTAATPTQQSSSSGTTTAPAYKEITTEEGDTIRFNNNCSMPSLFRRKMFGRFAAICPTPGSATVKAVQNPYEQAGIAM
jgi:hypothetical protein